VADGVDADSMLQFQLEGTRRNEVLLEEEAEAMKRCRKRRRRQLAQLGSMGR
jgi:hypothetical protein